MRAYDNQALQAIGVTEDAAGQYKAEWIVFGGLKAITLALLHLAEVLEAKK